MKNILSFGISFLLSLFCLIQSGCYAVRSSSGGGQTKFNPPRKVDAADIALPRGYQIEALAENLTFPTAVTFDDDGHVYVTESGYCYGEVFTVPRLLRINRDGTVSEIAKGRNNGPWTGVTWHRGAFYVAEGGVLEGGRILKITGNGEISALVEHLPSVGDHHANGPVVGPDGMIYFSIGTASNSGVIGTDNSDFGWLKRFPDFHDIPGQDIVLYGWNFATSNPLEPGKGTAVTGAFTPFGRPSRAGQLVKGQIPCTGGVFRVSPDGGRIELVAWGFRNPFGLSFSPEGTLYVTDNGYDVRGSRPVWGSPDVLWHVKPGTWYGWPDFVAGKRIEDRYFKAQGREQPRYLLASHPNPPPQPVAQFGVHSSADGLDFSTSQRFGHVGQAFVALFGDQAPTTDKVLHPVGFKVVRVNVQNGVIEDFAINRARKYGPASKIGGGGLERPVAVRFSPDGASLYVVDFGVLMQRSKKSIPVAGTGVLWRINLQPGETP